MKIIEAMHSGAAWRTPDTPVAELAKIMRDQDIGAIPISEDSHLVGMVTDRDIVCRGLAKGKDTTKLVARDIMTHDVVSCRVDEDVEDAIYLMEQKRVRRLPVLNENNRLVGMLSLGDLSHAVNRELTGELAKSVSAHH